MATDAPLTPLDALEIAHDGLLILSRLTSLVADNTAAQFVHKYVRTDEKYVVRHEREGCEFCDLIDRLDRSLEQLRQFARQQSEVKP